MREKTRYINPLLAGERLRCFACKEQRGPREIKKSGESCYGKGRWYLCVYCSDSYAERKHVELAAKAWKSGLLCPRCESWRRYEIRREPMVVACGDCSFVFTLNAAS